MITVIVHFTEGGKPYEIVEVTKLGIDPNIRVLQVETASGLSMFFPLENIRYWAKSPERTINAQ